MFESLAGSPVAITLIGFIGAIVTLVGIYVAQAGVERVTAAARPERT
jgi:hypothetical protein